MGNDSLVEGLDSLEELVGYLLNPRLEVRELGAQVALQLTATEAGRRGLLEAQVLPTLCRLTADDARVAETAISTLINVCADGCPAVTEELLARGIVDRLMETVVTQGCTFRDRALMLLANVTSAEPGARRMMQLREEEGAAGGGEDRPSLAGLHVRRLLRSFVGAYDPRAEQDEWQHAASVVCNVSTLREGRELLRRRDTALLQALLPQLTSPNAIRRRGVASAVRNCCFEEADHVWLIRDLDVIPHLLYPLMGPDFLDDDDKVGMDPRVYLGGVDKEREPDADVRRALLETILLFCSTRDCREELRQRQVYPVIREADQAETDEEISQVMYNIVNFLQRDEGADREGINARPDAPLPDKAPLPLPVDPNAAKQALDALD